VNTWFTHALVSDEPDSPELTQEYLPKWEVRSWKLENGGWKALFPTYLK
jgi:hypothetical protein